MAGQPNIYDSHWVRCGSKAYSASKIVRYLSRRPEDKERATSEDRWRDLDERDTFGNAEAFKEEANRRRAERLASAEERGVDIGQDHSPKNVQYLHVVISPRGREDMDREDFRVLAEPWVRGEDGRLYEHYGAIHRDDPEGPKLHLVVARDKLRARELEAAKERGDGLVLERERSMGREVEPERGPGRGDFGGGRERGGGAGYGPWPEPGLDDERGTG